MTMSGSSDLYIVELVLYLLISPFALYLTFRHGSAGALGYFYLNASCGVRIAADIISLLPANRDATHPTMASAILASIGLSPLLLALSGFLHEAHVHLVDVTQTMKQARKTKRWLWVAQLQIHSISILGMALAIVGSIRIASTSVSLSASELNNDDKLRSAGSAMLLVLWACLVQYSLYLLYIARKVSIESGGGIEMQKIARWILLATPYAGLRCISSVLYTFDHEDSNLNPITGALWVKVILVVLPGLGAVISLCISGWIGRSVLASRGRRISEEVQYEAVLSSKQ